MQSNGGLYYADRDEFIECLKLLLARRARCAKRSAETAANTSAETTGGKWCWAVRADFRKSPERR